MNQPRKQQAVGRWAEDLVLRVFLKSGYHFLWRNYLVPSLGELDLVFSKNQSIHIVEVKSRKSDDLEFGGATAINGHKRYKLRRAAAVFLQRESYGGWDVHFWGAILEHSVTGEFVNLSILPIF